MISLLCPVCIPEKPAISAILSDSPERAALSAFSAVFPDASEQMYE